MAEGALIGAAAMQTVGGLSAAKTQKQAAREKVDQLNLLAQEEEFRNRKNTILQKQEAQRLQSAQTAAFAKGGVDVGQGAPLSVLEDTASSIFQEIAMRERENSFRLNQIRFEAAQTKKMARKQQMASLLGTGGALGMTGAQYSQIGKGS